MKISKQGHEIVISDYVETEKVTARFEGFALKEAKTQFAKLMATKRKKYYGNLIKEMRKQSTVASRQLVKQAQKLKV